MIIKFNGMKSLARHRYLANSSFLEWDLQRADAKWEETQDGDRGLKYTNISHQLLRSAAYL